MPFSFSIMTFNLRHGWAEDGAHAWANRQKSAAAMLGHHRPDIVCFQEVNHFQLDFVTTTLTGYKLAGDLVDRGKFWEHRPIALAPGLDLIEAETFNLSETPDKPSRSWGSRFIRQATRALIRAGGAEVAVYNTHLDFAEDVQARQAEVIFGRMVELDQGRPVVLAGDFNSPPTGRVYRFLTGRDPFNGRRGDLKDAMPRPRQFTYHRFTGQPAVGYIDWILYRGLDLVDPATVIYEKHFGLYPSDHFPVKAVLGLGQTG